MCGYRDTGHGIGEDMSGYRDTGQKPGVVMPGFLDTGKDGETTGYGKREGG